MPDFAVVTAFKATDRISPAFSKMGNAADRFGRRASASMGRAAAASNMMLGAMRGLLPVIGAAGILKFANDSIEAWNTQAVAVANVEAGLKSTNNAIGMTSQQLQRMASNWQSVGIFGDETILQNVTAQFLTFGSIGKQNFDKMQGAAMDITAKLYGVKASGEQLRDVTIMLGKAMDDPARGMTALRRRGIQFTDQQEQMLKVMQMTQGREVAQAHLLKEIAHLYGGVNAALAKTDKGMEIAARNKLGDSMEMIGKQLVPAKQALLDLAVFILPVFNQVLPPMIDFIKDMKYPILAIVGGLVAWKTAMIGVAIWQVISKGIGWVKYLWDVRELIAGVIKRTGAWAAAQKGLNFAIALCPLVFILSAAVYWLIYLNDHIDEMINLFHRLTGVLDHPIIRGLLSGVLGASTVDILYATRGAIEKGRAEGRLAPPNQAAREGAMSNQGSTTINQYLSGVKSETSTKTSRGAPPIQLNQLGAN